MSEDNTENRQGHRNEYDQGSDAEHALEEHIIHALHDSVAQMHLTPATRAHIMRRIATPNRPRFIVLASSLAAIIIIVFSLAAYLIASSSMAHHLPQAMTAIRYTIHTTLNTPTELANGGHLVSLDPTGHSIIYQDAHDAGLMYTANLNNPSGSNVLAMRYAREAAWAPDGSALVTTIYPTGEIEPLLALVRTGQYMNTLGHVALAATWLPTSNQHITYVTQARGIMQLWDTPPQRGQRPKLLATMPLPTLVQHILWSGDGSLLALVTTTGNTPSPQSLNQPSRAIYILNIHTNSLQKLDIPSNNQIGAIAWSPNGHYLTYEAINAQGQSVLSTFDLTQQKTLFTITPQHKLLGWSWSPDSNTLLYSDGGILASHTLHGAPITFPATQSTLIDPLWTADEHILCMNVHDGVGQLTLLSQSK